MKKLSESDMDAVIDTWRWRISRLGFNQKTFALEVSKPQPSISIWLNKSARPTLTNFNFIEERISKLEKKSKLVNIR